MFIYIKYCQKWKDNFVLEILLQVRKEMYCDSLLIVFFYHLTSRVHYQECVILVES